MRMIKLPSLNAYSLFYGGGLLAGLLGAITLGPPIGRHICAIIVIGVGACALMRVFDKSLLHRWNVGAFVALTALFGLSVIGAFLYPVRGNLIYAQYFLYNLCGFAIILALLPTRRNVIKSVVLVFVVVVAMVAFCQVTYLFFGFGMDPTMVQYADVVSQSDVYNSSGVRSVFFNSNDLAVTCCMLMLYFIYGCEQRDRARLILTALLSMMVVFSGSRSGLVVACLIVAGYYLTNRRRILWFAGTAGSGIGVMMWLTSATGLSIANSYFGAKIATLTALGSDYLTGGAANMADGSMAERAATYLQFIHKFWEVGAGSLVANDYSYLLKGNALMAQDPHSLVIELSLLYGYAGLVAFIVLMAWVFFSIRRGHGNIVALVSVSLVFILGFVSSSSIGHHDFWILLYAFVCGARVPTTNSTSRHMTSAIDGFTTIVR